MDAPLFPNYMQMRPRAPRRVWDALRVLSVVAGLALCISLIVWPRIGLFALWGVLVPLLPLLFFIAPGFWRNICPLAASNQVPRRFGFTRARTLHPTVRAYGFLVPIALFLTIVPARKVLFNTNGTAVAVLLLACGSAAFLGGVVFKGKSGWCSSFCPLLPVQRVYGQTPFVVVRNSHCEPCVGCAKNCYDFNPHVAQLADLYDADPYRGAYRKIFAGALPALVLAFYTVDSASGWDILGMYGTYGLYILGGIGAFFVLDSVLRVSTGAVAVVFGAAALDLYYWFTWPYLADRIAGSSPGWFVWPARIVVWTLSAVWVLRTLRKERRFVEEATAEPQVRLGAGAEAMLEGAAASGRPDVTIVQGETRIAAVPGSTLLDIVERHGLPIEAGCRMGMCGSDPICVVSGAEHLSPVGDEERVTIERLGLAANTRMACSARVGGPVSISLMPEQADQTAAVAEVRADVEASIRNVVVIGNGIAGITAADHVRRRHPNCAIDVVAREPYHLYNRMAITRLIYGGSAMQGLFLMPEQWYEQHRITTWLNTRVVAIDRERQQVRLGTGETLSYDRLILTAGSKNFVPPIEGFGAEGSFVLREAEDAMRIRAYIQERSTRRAVIAGGGLLGLEAAYALKKLGLHVTVLEVNDRLLHRQLDERASELLQRYLEGLGIEVALAVQAELEVAGGRVAAVKLSDGNRIDAEIFLVSAGIRPNIEVARDAGLEINRGVVVDAQMRTSDPNIFAAGDIAEHDELISGLWPTAVDQAQVAAANAAGGNETYTGTVPVTMLKVTGVDLTSAGRFEPAGPEDEVIAQDDVAESRYRKLVVNGGRVVGAILLGYAVEASAVVRAVKEEQDVTESLELLRAGDWSLFAEEVQAPAAAVA
jgi:NADPH-dependent 2,4-dienoyl-CoA reductase/sulfur reductase-like enzyme/ferredoxin